MPASIGSPSLWAGFIAFVLLVLALDLGLFHRQARPVTWREALGWSVLWFALALVFGAGVWGTYGADRGLEFLTGYLIEKSLSVDNLFVFLVIFSTLGIPARAQHRVLFVGIVTALVLRAAMIFAGAALLARFHALVYVFGGFLILTGIKLLHERGPSDEHEKLEKHVAALRRWIPWTSRFDGDRFVTCEGGRRVATPLLLALILVELADVVFAVDSIPAIFAVTRDPFIVFTSNIFAILGLRALFFVLAHVVERVVYLRVGLAAVLTFVGAKMVAVDWFHVPPLASLGVIAGILVATVVASHLAGAGGTPALAPAEPEAPPVGTDPVGSRPLTS